MKYKVIEQTGGTAEQFTATLNTAAGEGWRVVGYCAGYIEGGMFSENASWWSAVVSKAA